MNYPSWDESGPCVVASNRFDVRPVDVARDRLAGATEQVSRRILDEFSPLVPPCHGRAGPDRCDFAKLWQRAGTIADGASRGERACDPGSCSNRDPRPPAGRNQISRPHAPSPPHPPHTPPPPPPHPPPLPPPH